jgi:putative heme-binding domain-containing protein
MENHSSVANGPTPTAYCILPRFRCRVVLAIAACAWIGSVAVRAGDDPQAADSPLVKLLKSGRVPEARQGAVIEMIGRRGSADDLGYIYQHAIAPNWFAAAIKVKALAALAEAARNRGLRPARDLAKLVPLVKPPASGSDAALEACAIELAGLWKLDAAAEALQALAGSNLADERVRSLALDSLGEIGGRAGRSRIEALAAAREPAGTRMLAVSAMARFDVEKAAALAAEILSRSRTDNLDLKPLLAAFLNRQGGADVLAAAISRQAAMPADAAKMALRAVYALGRSDQALVAALSRAAGIAAESKPLSPTELNELVARVAAQGDPARGERNFRRADLNCMSCHSVSKAGGDVGPDLSSIGQTSPADYIINSILNPDQSIKEQFQTLVVLTNDGHVFQGVVADKDEQRIVLKEATGATRVVPVSTIEDQKAGGSLMPRGLANLMTRAEFIDLARFLSELGKPGPYAIRATPTIQRWRVLSGPSAKLTDAIPDAAAFRDQVLAAGPARWSTAYAKVSGALPLDEMSALADGKVLYLQGELNLTAAGLVKIRLDSAQGVQLWIDDVPAPAGAADATTALSVGRHMITLRVDTKARSSQQVKVEVDKPSGSPAEFTVVGGR